MEGVTSLDKGISSSSSSSSFMGAPKLAMTRAMASAKIKKVWTNFIVLMRGRWEEEVEEDSVLLG